MGDVDPTSQTQKFTPRQTTLVDSFAETKRVTTAMMRANPLRDAYIDDGLMKWKGNYGGDFLWIGEFLPEDPILGKHQRGFSLVRDDSNGNSAIVLYDPFAGSANPVDQPLRQLLRLGDGDGIRMFHEAQNGGLEYPWGVIPLYPQVFDQEGTGVRPAINGAKEGEDRLLFSGVGSMVGNSVYFQAACNSNGPTYRFWAVITWQNGDTFTSGNHEGSGATTFDQEWDFRDFPDRRGGWVKVEVYGRHLSGGDEWSWIYPKECFSRGFGA